MAVLLSLFAGAGQQFFTNAGVPLAGGKIFTYGAGGSTPQATYTTSAGNIAHSNPIVLDAAGRVPGGGEIWLTSNLAYKFVLQTSANVTVQTLDNVGAGVDGATLGAPTGSSLVGFLQAGAGAVAQTVQGKLRQTISVIDFGADPTGVADSYQAFVDAITSAIQGSGPFYYSNPEVYVPLGTYKISQTINLTNQVKIYGDGSGMGYSRSPTLNFTTPGGTGFVCKSYLTGTSSTGTIFEGLTIQGTAGTADASGGHGILVRIPIWIKGCQIFNFAGDGVRISADTFSGTGNANGWKVDQLTISGTNNGMWVEGGDANTGVAISVNVLTAKGWGIYDNSFLGNTYVGCHTSTTGTNTVVNYSGTSYYCIDAALGGATTPGTSSAVWATMPANGAYAAWVSGKTYQLGGAYASVNANARNVFVGCYSEADQPPSKVVSPSLTLGGLHAAGFTAITAPVMFSHNSAIGAPSFLTGGIEIGTSYSGIQTLTAGVGLQYSDTTGVYNWTFQKSTGAWGYKWANLGGLGRILFYDRNATVANGYARDIDSASAPTASLGALGIGPHYFGETNQMKWRSLGTAAPVSGAYLQGDIIYNSAPTAGGFIGWVCTASGSPGTWKTFGAISV